MGMFSSLCKKEKVTVVLVTHDMEEVANRADRVTVLQRGKLIMEGTPREVFCRGEELASAGLSVPFAAELATSLRVKGFNIKNLATLQEAERELERILKAKR